MTLNERGTDSYGEKIMAGWKESDMTDVINAQFDGARGGTLTPHPLFHIHTKICNFLIS